MDHSTAEIVIIVGAIVGVIVWLTAIWCYFSMLSQPDESSKTTFIKGIKDPDDAVRKLLRSLLKQQCVRILDRVENGAKLQVMRSTITVDVRPEKGGVAADVELDTTGLSNMFRWMMIAWVLLFEPAVIVAVVGLLWFLVVPSENPAVRGQAFQVVQIIHVLWPPFLVFGLYKVFRNAVKTIADKLPIQIEVGE